MYPGVIKLFSLHFFSSCSGWLHSVPVMWNGVPSRGLPESSVLHWQHWNWCCHELDNEPYGRPRCAELWELAWKRNNQSVCLFLSFHDFLSIWLVADFSAPLVLPGCSSGPGTTPTESVSEEHLATIVSMGFSRDQATKALRATVRIDLCPAGDEDMTNFTATRLNVALCQNRHSCSFFYSATCVARFLETYQGLHSLKKERQNFPLSSTAPSCLRSSGKKYV